MQYRRSLLALLTGFGFLSACSGGNFGSNALPTAGAQSASRAAQGLGGGPTPPPVTAPLSPLAAVDLIPALLPTFALTNSSQCFGASQSNGNGEDDQQDGNSWNHGGGENHHRGESSRGRNHRNDGNAGAQPVSAYGNAYTPSADTILIFGAFSLTNPCAAGSSPRHGHRDEDASQRHVMSLITPPPVGGGAFIVSVDAADPLKTQVPVDGPASYDAATDTYSFAPARVSRLFRAGHTYVFALAAPATPTPAPTPSPTPKPEGDD